MAEIQNKLKIPRIGKNMEQFELSFLLVRLQSDHLQYSFAIS